MSLSCILNIMAADDLTTVGTMAPAPVVLTQYSSFGTKRLNPSLVNTLRPTQNGPKFRLKIQWSLFPKGLIETHRCQFYAWVVLFIKVELHETNRLVRWQLHHIESDNALTLPLSQWSSSGNPVAIQCAWNLDPSVHWNATGERNVGSQCVSGVLPVAFQWSSSVFQLWKLTLDRHWNTTGC